MSVYHCRRAFHGAAVAIAFVACSWHKPRSRFLLPRLRHYDLLRRSNRAVGSVRCCEGQGSLASPERRKFTSLQLWMDCRRDTQASQSSVPVDCDMILIPSGQKACSGQCVFDKEGQRLLGPSGEIVAAVFSGSVKEAQQNALAAIGSVPWILLDVCDSAFVPAENLIAAGRQAGTKIAISIKEASEIAGLANALQLGVDALVVPVEEDKLWQEAVVAKEARATSCSTSEASQDEKKEEVMWATVLAVDAAKSTADRVCVDLIQMLKEGEALLIGSSAKALCFVEGETVVTGLVPPRPFRVNAGPVHSYVSMADGSTKYLSEITAGDLVRVVDAAVAAESGRLSQRLVAVGRCKIEPRPVMLLSFETPDGRNGQLFLQIAETVRVRARRDSQQASKGVTELVVGEEILVVMSQLGTHVGQRIGADVAEK